MEMTVSPYFWLQKVLINCGLIGEVANITFYVDHLTILGNYSWKSYMLHELQTSPLPKTLMEEKSHLITFTALITTSYLLYCWKNSHLEYACQMTWERI